jgi:hypothetical protein
LLARLLPPQLFELSLLPIDLGLLGVHAPLYFRVLILSRLELVADERAA